MQLNINDKIYNIDLIDRSRKLLWILRDELGLIGTRYGCGAGFCGACTVHINGQPTRSCITPVSAIAPDARIRTVEGLAENGSLHPVQQAFIELQVPQCGWCMSGQMMSATALLEQSPNPSREDIRAAMKNNYCRCGCYHRIALAVERAAKLMP
ncbi:MAG: (2Fe-2S)-binding protein [Anaerolineales bacterium]|nr:(2Fe-2S)-binding protein [Anaerolineales bacterium]